MAATFDPTLPTDRDWLRFMLGDVDVSAPLLDDATYDAALARFTDRRAAGAELASGLASRFAQEPDSIAVSGEITLSWRVRVQRWTQLAAIWTSDLAAETAKAQSSLQSIAPSRGDEDGCGEYVGCPYPYGRY